MEGGELDSVCDELRALIEAQRLPEKVIQRVGKAFSSGKKHFSILIATYFATNGQMRTSSLSKVGGY